MKTRHKARESAIQILYQCEATPLATDPMDRANQLSQFFEHFAVPDAAREYCARIVSGTVAETEKLDALIEAHLKNWKMARLAQIDRSILRLATYEILNEKDLAAAVIIDEAVELAKSFGTADSPSFINGILDAIASAQHATA